MEISSLLSLLARYLALLSSVSSANIAKNSAVSSSSDSKGHAKIEHIVVLMQENRAFDHIFGWFEGSVDGLTGEEFNLLDPSDKNSEKLYVDDDCPYINQCDPGKSKE